MRERGPRHGTSLSSCGSPQVRGLAMPEENGGQGRVENCRPCLFSRFFPLPGPFSRDHVTSPAHHVTAGQWTNAAMLPLFRPGPTYVRIICGNYVCRHPHSRARCGLSVGPGNRRGHIPFALRRALPASADDLRARARLACYSGFAAIVTTAEAVRRAGAPVSGAPYLTSAPGKQVPRNEEYSSDCG